MTDLDLKLPWRIEYEDRYKGGRYEGGDRAYRVLNADGQTVMAGQTYYPEAPDEETAVVLVELVNKHGGASA